MYYLGELLQLHTVLENLAFVHKRAWLDFIFFDIALNNVLLNQLRVAQNWVKRCHLFVGKVVLKSFLVDLVEELRLALDQQGDVSYIQIRHVLMRNPFNVLYLSQLKLKIQNFVLVSILDLSISPLSLAVAPRCL